MFIRNLEKHLVAIVVFLIILVILGLIGIKTYLDKQEGAFDDKLAMIQKQIALLQDSLQQVTGENAKTALSLQEIANRQAIRSKSQEDLITEAVAKVAPAVVSIVISKDVPQLEVTYQNPFGDDPFFKDFGFQVPVYRQKGTTEQKVGAGTGFIIDPRGYILTNKHVVGDEVANYTVLLSNGTQKAATVIYKDSLSDVAIIKINSPNLKTVTLGNSADLKLGQAVVAIGNALGEYNNSVSVGIISGLNRELEAATGSGQIEKLTGVIQTDAAINPGNSGGPLINTQGQVVGINVATVLGSSNISFSIPIDIVKSILTKIIPN